MKPQSPQNPKTHLEVLNKLDSVYLTLDYSPAEKTVTYRWRGFIRLPEIKDGFRAILDFLNLHQCEKMFGDHSGIVGPWNEGNDWLVSSWVPEASKTPLKYWAVYTGDDLFSNISLELFLTSNSKSSYLVKISDTLNEGIAWLKTTKTTKQLNK
jgi:hypothetical protein